MYARVAEISLTLRGQLSYTLLTMAAKKKTPSTVKTLQARPKVAAKTATTKPTQGAKKVAAKRTRSKVMVLEEKTAAEKGISKKTSLDALRYFVKTYANL